MNPTIIISKVDEHYLITGVHDVYIRTKWEDASKFIEELLNKKEQNIPTDANGYVKYPWVDDMIKEGQ